MSDRAFNPQSGGLSDGRTDAIWDHPPDPEMPSGIAKGGIMKAGIIFTGTGPILLLTSYDHLGDPNLKAKLAAKGIKKYIAYEVDEETVKQRYGQQFNVVMGDLSQSDDLRVLDYDGHHVFYNFALSELGAPILQES